MSAVARLFVLYFAATPLTRGLAALGLVLIAAGLAGYLYIPTWALGTGMSSTPLWYQAVVTALPWYGLMLLFSSSTLLPVIVERLAFGRSILVLPGGRVRVLLSAVAAAAAIALLTAAAAELWFFLWPPEARPQQVFSRTLLVVFSTISLMYIAVWFIGKSRGIWRLLASLVVVLGVVLPIGLIGRPVGVPPLIWVGVAAWIGIAILLLGGSRIRYELAGRSVALPRRFERLLPTAAYGEGNEISLLLGTSRPGIVAIAQAVPIFAATWLIVEPVAWLMCLTIFAAISGAVTSVAASRSRALWLRFGWTRTELFRRVEAAYWRYNAYALGVLLLAFVLIGTGFELPTPVLALGLPLLALCSTVSAYLGLLMTRGLRWREAALGVGTMALLLYAAVAVDDANTRLTTAVALEAALAVLALTYRSVALARWQNLDWMQCRPSASARGAA